jgi:alpha-L-fucosidase
VKIAKAAGMKYIPSLPDHDGFGMFDTKPAIMI